MPAAFAKLPCAQETQLDSSKDPGKGLAFPLAHAMQIAGLLEPVSVLEAYVPAAHF
jgi:hypothetical protein